MYYKLWQEQQKSGSQSHPELLLPAKAVLLATVCMVYMGGTNSSHSAKNSLLQKKYFESHLFYSAKCSLLPCILIIVPH